MDYAYKIESDFASTGESQYDANHIPFEHSDKASIIFSNPKYEKRLPKRIFFQSDFGVIGKVDYPANDLNVPILSQKMVELLATVGDVNSQYVPVTMIDDTILGKKFDQDGNLLSHVTRMDSFSALFLNEFSTLFDEEKSVFEPSALDPKKPGYISKLCLREGAKPVPTVFRIKEASGFLFISSKGKKALELAGISGIIYSKVELR